MKTWTLYGKIMVPLLAFGLWFYFLYQPLIPWSLILFTVLLSWLAAGLSDSLRLIPRIFSGLLLFLLILAAGKALFRLILLFSEPSYSGIFYTARWRFLFPLYVLLFISSILYRMDVERNAPLVVLILTLSIPVSQLLIPENGGGDLDISEALLFFLLFFCAFSIILLSFGRGWKRGRLLRFLGLLLLLTAGIWGLSQLYKEQSVVKGGGLLEQDAFHFSFTEYLQLQPEVSLSDELILLYRKEGGAERMLIRRMILAGYDPKKGFFRENLPEEEQDNSPLYLPAVPLELPDPRFEGRSDVIQDYYLINLQPDAFLALNYPLRILPYKHWEDSSFISVFQVESRVFTESPWMLITLPDTEMDPSLREYYTRWDSREDIDTLALSITEDSLRPYQKVMAIEEYLKENYFYSLKPGVSLKGDPLGHFLFTSQKGYCSYFAFSMAALCRSLKIPTRVVLGFWVDPKSEVLNFYPVLANQAHAWVEVYFNEYGWVEFDPTSNEPAPGEDIRFASADPEEYRNLIKEILEHNEDLIPRSLSEEGLIQEERFLWLESLSPRKAVWWILFLLMGYLSILSVQRCSIFLFLPGRKGRALAYYQWLRRDLYRRFPEERRRERGRLLPRQWESCWKGKIHSLSAAVDRYQQFRFSDNFIDWNKEELKIQLSAYKQQRDIRCRGRNRLSAWLYPFPQRRFR